MRWFAMLDYFKLWLLPFLVIGSMWSSGTKRMPLLRLKQHPGIYLPDLKSSAWCYTYPEKNDFVTWDSSIPNWLDVYHSPNMSRPLSISINIYQHLSTSINIYQRLSTSINIYQPSPTTSGKKCLRQAAPLEFCRWSPDNARRMPRDLDLGAWVMSFWRAKLMDSPGVLDLPNPRKIYENIWKYMKIYENIWKYMKISRSFWTLTIIYHYINW